MFNKKRCRCGTKVSKDYDFCPKCGRKLKEEDFGLLGKEDINLNDIGIKMPFGFNKIFNSLLGQVDRQFKELDKEISRDFEKKKIRGNGISISISASGNKAPVVKVQKFGDEFKEIKPQIIRTPQMEIDEGRTQEIAKLPRKEAQTSVRRMSNKVVYEIDLPGVKNIKDVVINKLENSIEIKAFSDNLAYFKLLPVNLPILRYGLRSGKLVLELAGE